MKKPKNTQPSIESAKRYVDQQLETMKKHGAAPKLSADAYKSLVQKVAKATWNSLPVFSIGYVLAKCQQKYSKNYSDD